MELIEGESPKGPLPLEEALRIARQISSALEDAHEKGIIHRDLKPGNIKIKPDGMVKVLDFGLAKLATERDDSASPEVSPTLSMTATRAGMILGTAAYMSPEQAKGKTVDKRADIWAFGVVVYEMLSGERLFHGDDVTETLAAVVLKAPDLERAPVEVRRLLKKCLEKDPKKRLRDIGDVWELLDVEPARVTGMAAPPPKARTAWLPWILSGVLLLALAATVAWIFKPSPPLAITRFPFTPGEGQVLSTTSGNLAISPDGTQMAYVANNRLYLHSMAELEARPIPGTDLGGNVRNPVFSPDGKSLAFFELSDATIRRIAVSGGAAVTICTVEVPTNGMSWSEDGIVFAQAVKGILRVSPNGGKPELLAAAKNNDLVEGPQMLPGGEAVMFTLATGDSVTTAPWDKAQIIVQTLKSGARKVVLEGGSDGRYLPTGHLVYALSGVLYAVPFDLKRLETTGGPVGIVEGIRKGNAGAAQVAFSGTGSLIYIPGPVSAGGSGQSVLALVDRKGDIEPLKIPSGAYSVPRVSRDGKRVAYQVDDGKEASIWIYELSGATAPRRLTLAGTGANRDPIWSSPTSSRDAERVAFQSDREGDLGIFWQLADGTGTAERLTKPDKGITHIPDSWSPDGQMFSFTEEKGNSSAVWIYSLRNKKATLFAEDPGLLLGNSVFSPDGRWVVYQAHQKSDLGSSRAYVKPFPAAATRYQVPQDQDTHHPLWSPDGKELLYTAGPSLFGGVSVATKPSLSFGSPVRAPKSGFTTGSPAVARPYDILPDGKHLIGVAPPGQAQTGGGPLQMQVVLNWFEDVKQRAPVR
jgi:serine/threonine-protein kinase